MIDKKINGKDLIGKKCRPVFPLRNGGGAGVSTETICEIVDVVRGHGFTIKTEKCKHCGMYAYISGVKRAEIELAAGRDEK